MARWEPGAKDRLRAAAFELFAEQGYEQTTVAQIAARTGLTERTFYRHFADKREAVFDGQDRFLDAFVGGIASAPVGSGTVETIRAALDAIAAYLPPERQDFSRRRQAVIDGDVALQERELYKLVALRDALIAAFVARDTGQPEASLAAEITISVFVVSLRSWQEGPDGADLAEVQRAALDTTQAMFASA